MHGQPAVDQLPIRGGSQWSTLSRELAEDLVDQERHAPAWRRHSFFMQTDIIPDESLIPTFAANSRHADRTRMLSFFWLKSFSGQNPYNLCR